MSDWIIGFIEQWGYWGIAALMALENIVPPIPSELIMPFAGYVAASGELHVVGVVAAGSAGSLIGTLPWYVAGRLLGFTRVRGWASRHGRWLTVSPADVDKAQRWFDRRGPAAVFLGRMVPAVRSVISLPAGLADMSPARFLGWSYAGSLLWTGALTALGFALENRYDEAAKWLDPVAKAILGLAVASYVFRVSRFTKRPR